MMGSFWNKNYRLAFRNITIADTLEDHIYWQFEEIIIADTS